QEDVLGDLLGARTVAEEVPGQAVDHGLVLLDQFSECVVIAGPGAGERSGKLDRLGHDCRHPGGYIRDRSRRVAAAAIAGCRVLGARCWVLGARGWSTDGNTSACATPLTLHPEGRMRGNAVAG